MFKDIKKRKVLKKAVFIGLLLLIVVIFSQQIQFTSSDLGRHIKNGEMVWQDKAVLFSNYYSYTETDFSFINHHWLSGVVYNALYSIGGFVLLSIFNIILILSTFVLAFKIARKKAGFYLLSFLSIPVIFLLSERVEIRPEVFSYFFIILTWFILDGVSEKKNFSLLWWLLPLLLLWVNLHIYFFIGLALVGAKVLSEFLPLFIEQAGDFRKRFYVAWAGSKRWIYNFFYLILACLLNPNTYHNFLYPFNILKKYGYEVAENKSVFFLDDLMLNNNFALFKLLFLVLILSWLAYFVFKKKMKWFELFISIIFSFLALFASRNLAIFSLISLIIISTNLDPVFKYLDDNIIWLKRVGREKLDYVKLWTLLALIVFSLLYVSFDAKRSSGFMKNPLGWGVARGSMESINFFRGNNLQGPIFNNYDLGSALAFWLYPEEKVFVDNRPEAYSVEFFTDVYKPMQSDDKAWQKYSEEYGINVIYFSHTDSTPWANSFLYRHLQDDEWSLVYFDRYTTIFLKKNELNQDKIDELGIDSWKFRQRFRNLSEDSSLKEKFYLASLARSAQHEDLAEEVYRGILFKYPGHGQALYSLASLYSVSTERAALENSVYYFERALSNGQKLPNIYNQMALVHWQLGDYEQAEKVWKKSLRLDRHKNNASDYLEQIRKLRLGGRLVK